MVLKQKVVYFLALCVVLFSNWVHAAIDPSSILPAEEAYKTQLFATEDGVSLQFTIADGYYLYKDKLEFSSDGPSLGQPEFSPAQSTTDEFFGTQAVYFKVAQINIPFSKAHNPAQPYRFHLNYQGCAEVGICYPPTKAVFVVDKVGLIAPQASGKINVFSNSSAPNFGSPATNAEADAPASNLAASNGGMGFSLSQDAVWRSLLTFFIAGIGLSLTACM